MVVGHVWLCRQTSRDEGEHGTGEQSSTYPADPGEQTGAERYLQRDNRAAEYCE